MSFEATRALIAQKFKDEYEGQPGALPVVYDNHERTDGKPWGRFALAFGDRDLIDINGPNRRGLGILYFQVLLPEGTGTRPATQAADALAAAFERQQIRSGNLLVTFGIVTLENAGVRVGMDQKNVVIPFRWETY